MERKLLMTIRGVTKQYPGTLALNNIDMEIYGGEVLGLIGENGAGKSTLMKIMIGAETATSGTLEMHGKPYAPHTPIEAMKLGCGMVFQEQSLIMNLTVAQNIFIGREEIYVKHGLVDTRRMNEDAQKVLQGLEITNIKSGTRVNRLDFADRQMVEIAKVFDSVGASDGDGSIILLDEPTSVLSEKEIQQLFRHVRRLCQQGNAVIFVSHKLDEVMEIADRICVFKDGCKVDEMPNEDLDEGILYEKMVGKTASGEYYHVPRQRVPEQEVVLELKKLSKRGYFADVDLQLHKGEILGICGVVGSGKEDLCAVICGDEDPTGGEIVVRGQPQRFTSPSKARKAASILSVPRERRVEGIIGELSAYENICMSNFDGVRRNGVISDKLAKAQAEQYVKELSIKLPSVDQRVGRLSGGNAQKVVFARILASNCDILILDHPTRGVDVGAKTEIYSIIRDIADQGKSLIVLGDTLDETIGLSNRVAVMKDGEITKMFDAPPDGKPEQVDIVKYMM
ncbi:MAG: sugar ABC transporter ATP-binding protein [Clostridia bacterium]|nr:sugar ABC transporter ATP-binding protein [Clostridia bacterium]MBQ6327128.1 sugar ABC transporter ATP-binding protein [Clostridia bacterium]